MDTTVEDRGATPMSSPPSSATSLVVCSLEDWGTVRRRIRILVDELVAMDPALIVAPPAGMEIGFVPIVVRQSAR